MALQTFTAGQILTAAQMNTLQANAYNQTVSTKTASYVLVAADKGTRVVMNAAGATTITVNTSLFSAGDTLFIQNIGAGTCTVTAGTATVTTAGSLALAQWGGGTLYFTSAGAAIFFSGSTPTWGTATGGIGSPTAVTIGGVNYEYLTFTSTGTLTITRAGFFDYLAIGGGGGSYFITTNFAGGGGGGGQVVIGSIYLSANQTVTIGAGGSFFDYTATGFTQGGNTSIGNTSPYFVQTASGNISDSSGNLSLAQGGVFIGGGVGGANGNTPVLQTENIVTGFRGGSSSAATNAGGGGGQSARGGNATSTSGGTGGAGYDVSAFIGGSEVRKAMGGGGGGSVTGGTAATGGVPGSATTTPSNGNANSGGGGGAGYGIATTGNGGSGIAYIRWRV